MPSFSAQNCTFNFQNAPKCPVFDTRLRNFTERILTSTLCKILQQHASIGTIMRKLRNFTEFCQSRFFHTQTTYGSYGWRQLSFNFHPAAFLFQKTHRLVKKSTNFIHLPSVSTLCPNIIAQSETGCNIQHIYNKQVAFVLFKNSCILGIRQPEKSVSGL